MSELPTGWTAIKLGSCGQWYGGSTPSKANKSFWSEGTIPWVSPKDMKVFDIQDSEDRITVKALEETNVRPYPVGTVLVVIRSGILSRTLPIAVARVVGTINQDLKGVLPLKGINEVYLAYYLIAHEQQILRTCCKSGTTVPSIDTLALHSYSVNVAPTNEQLRIVAKLEELLSDLESGVAALKRAGANLKRYRASILKAAVEGKLTEEWRAIHPVKEPASTLLSRLLENLRQQVMPSQSSGNPTKKKQSPKNLRKSGKNTFAIDTENLPQLPEEWCWASVQQVGKVQLGRQRAPQHHSGDYMRPYLRVANVFEDRIDINDVMQMNFTPDEFETYRLEYGDILLNEGQSMELVGRPALYRDEVPGACFTNTLVRFQAYEGLIAEYALVVFLAYLKSGRFQKIATITVNIAHLGAGRFAEIEFPLPPTQEQFAIVEEVKRLFSLVDAAERSINLGIARADRLRRSILKQAFEGKLVAQDPNDEPASILLDEFRSQSFQTTKTATAVELKRRAKGTKAAKKLEAKQ